MPSHRIRICAERVPAIGIIAERGNNGESIQRTNATEPRLQNPVGAAGLYPDRVGGLTLEHDVHDIAEGETHGTCDGETTVARLVGGLDPILEVLRELALDGLAAHGALGGRGIPLAGMAFGTPLGGVVGGSPYVAALQTVVVVVLLQPQDGSALGAVLWKSAPLPDRPFVSAAGTG